MPDSKLPELPMPAAYAVSIREGNVIFLPRGSLNTEGWAEIYKADQLRALQIATWNAAMEAAAKACEDLGPEMLKWWGEGQANAAAMDCASAIRALKEPQ